MQGGSGVIERLSYEESYRFLQREGWEGAGEVPPLPERPPNYFDEVLGLSFFRTYVEDGKMENLTIPRTYFSRSEVRRTSFAGTDLTESVANWNDFEEVDFSRADLTRFDLRASVFRRVRFESAILYDADLRWCHFEECIFEGANLAGARITRETGLGLGLSMVQLEQVDWQEEDGEEPDGG